MIKRVCDLCGSAAEDANLCSRVEHVQIQSGSNPVTVHFQVINSADQDYCGLCQWIAIRAASERVARFPDPKLMKVLEFTGCLLNPRCKKAFGKECIECTTSSAEI